MIAKLKDFRILSIALLYIIGFLPFLTVKVPIVGGAIKKSASMVDLAGNTFVATGKIFYVVPIVVILLILFLDHKISPKLIYLVAGIFGIGLTLFTVIFTGKRVATGYKHGPNIGFFLVLAVWVFVLVWTCVKDFAISKDSIQQNGIKAALTDVANQTLKEADIALNNMKNMNSGNSASGMPGPVPNVFCPSCGKPAGEPGTKFCPYCGAVLESTPVQMTCTNCGADLQPGTKFCRKCGAKVL
ncbi:MAG: zinc ribbon domain-containing protein [Lachnospiraceae bacterium]|nr:zinc ribbon domain-containing protein [Lachnospiraceae bacterium]